MPRLMERDDVMRTALKSDHCAATSDMQPFHYDPIDRMLLAQAKSEGIKIVSHDRQFPQYGDFVIKA